MAQLGFRRPIAAVLVTGMVIGLGGIAAARAAVITNSPSLPVLDNPYVSVLGSDCFSTANVCIGDGSVRLIAPASSSFSGGNQDITSDAIFTGNLTSFTTSAPLGTLTLTGTMEQLVLGRGADTDTGNWNTEIETLSLSGPALGTTLGLTLDRSTPSTGTTSDIPDGEGAFLISSFFDVFVDLQLEGTNLTATRGPIEFDLQPAPEPASLALLAAPLLALAAVRRRRSAGASIQRP
jgi:hypothetical protein